MTSAPHEAGRNNVARRIVDGTRHPHDGTPAPVTAIPTRRMMWLRLVRATRSAEDRESLDRHRLLVARAAWRQP